MVYFSKLFKLVFVCVVKVIIMDNGKNDFDTTNFFPDMEKFDVNYRYLQDLLKFEVKINYFDKNNGSISSINEKKSNYLIFVDKAIFVKEGKRINERFVRSVAHKINKNGELTDIFIYDAFSKTHYDIVAVSNSEFLEKIAHFEVKQEDSGLELQPVAYFKEKFENRGKGDPTYLSSNAFLEYVKKN